jgi:hypothetical protein
MGGFMRHRDPAVRAISNNALRKSGIDDAGSGGSAGAGDRAGSGNRAEVF